MKEGWNFDKALQLWATEPTVYLCVLIHNHSHIHFICSKREVPYFFQCYCCKLCKVLNKDCTSTAKFLNYLNYFVQYIKQFHTLNLGGSAQCTIVLTFQKKLSCKFVITIRWIFGVLYAVLKQNYKHKHTILVFAMRKCYEHILKIQFKLCSVFIWEPKLFSFILFTYANKRKRRPKQRDPYQNYNQLSSSMQWKLTPNCWWALHLGPKFQKWWQMHIHKRKYTKEKIDVALSS